MNNLPTMGTDQAIFLIHVKNYIATFAAPDRAPFGSQADGSFTAGVLIAHSAADTHSNRDATHCKVLSNSLEGFDQCVQLYLERLVVSLDRRHFPINLEQFIHCHLRRPDRILNRENHIVRDLDELSEENQVRGIARNRERPVAMGARHEHAGDVRHAAGNAIRRRHHFPVEIQVPAQFLQDLGAASFGHGFGDEIADVVRMNGISPEYLHPVRLANEMRLMRQHDGHEPVGILENQQ